MVGVDRVGMYVPGYALRMETLADTLKIPREKCFSGIGQEVMGVPPPDEDIVTMAAAAARICLEGVDTASISAVILSTESGIDQSKAASVYVHKLLNLPPSCLCWEVKQACSGSTFALLSALDYVARRPDKNVLVIASDIAAYAAGSPGELTQGAGAVALLVSHHPALLEIYPEVGSFTQDVMDFWRPNYSKTANVDGRFSIKVYQRALAHCWNSYGLSGGVPASSLSRLCFHQPFTRMADKALKSLSRVSGTHFEQEAIAASTFYNKQIGNTYSASMFIALCSLLEQDTTDLENHIVGLFGYGSGAVAAFYAGRINAGYRHHLQATRHQGMLANRDFIDYATYRRFCDHQLPTDGGNHRTKVFTHGPYRLAGISDHKRIYE